MKTKFILETSTLEDVLMTKYQDMKKQDSKACNVCEQTPCKCNKSDEKELAESQFDISEYGDTPEEIFQNIKNIIDRIALPNTDTEQVLNNVFTKWAGVEKFGDMIRNSDGTINDQAYREAYREASALANFGSQISDQWNIRMLSQNPEAWPRANNIYELSVKWFQLYKQLAKKYKNLQPQVAEGIEQSAAVTQEQLNQLYAKGKQVQFIKNTPVALVPLAQINKIGTPQQVQQVQQALGSVDQTSYTDEYKSKGYVVFQWDGAKLDLYVASPEVVAQKYVKFNGQLPQDEKSRGKIPSLVALSKLGIDPSNVPFFVKKVPTPMVSAKQLGLEGKTIQTSWGEQTVSPGGFMVREENGHIYTVAPDAQGLPIGYVPAGQQGVAEGQDDECPVHGSHGFPNLQADESACTCDFDKLANPSWPDQEMSTDIEDPDLEMDEGSFDRQHYFDANKDSKVRRNAEVDQSQHKQDYGRDPLDDLAHLLTLAGAKVGEKVKGMFKKPSELNELGANNPPQATGTSPAPTANTAANTAATTSTLNQQQREQLQQLLIQAGVVKKI